MGTLGTCSYNGVTFSQFADTSIRGRPRYDQAGRTVIGTEYTILVRDYLSSDVTSGFSTETNFLTIRRLLEKPGCELHYTGKGFGQLDINAPNSAALDIEWGPRPRIIEYKPTGSATTCKIVWECTTIIPDCSQATYTGLPMEFNFRVRYTQDWAGLTTRTYSGFLRIPQTRPVGTGGTIQNRFLSDNADAYRKNLMPPSLPGFRRKPEVFELDESKCRIDFTIIDEQFPSQFAPPPGVAEIEASHSVETNSIISNQYWGHIDATYTIGPEQTRLLAYTYFLQMARGRIAAAERFSDQGNGSPGPVLLTHFRMSEPNIYGTRAAAFSLGYTFVCTAEQLVAASGLWTIPPNSDWPSWAISMNGSTYQPEGRGSAGLTFQNGDDMIVDLCITGDKVPQSEEGSFTTNPGSGLGILNAYPPASSSFLWYEVHARVDTDDFVAEMKPLPQQTISISTVNGGGLAPNANRSASASAFAPQAQGQLLVVGLDQTDGTITSGDDGTQGNIISSNTDGYDNIYPPGQTTQPATVPQYRAYPSQYIILTGLIIRAGYLITPPVLTNIGGVPVVPANRKDVEFFDSGIVANFFGVPIVRAEFQQRYLAVALLPNNIGVPPTPTMSGF